MFVGATLSDAIELTASSGLSPLTVTLAVHNSPIEYDISSQIPEWDLTEPLILICAEPCTVPLAFATQTSA